MLLSSMGRRESEDKTVSKADAAQLLGVSLSTLTVFTKKGILSPAIEGERSSPKTRYLLSDISSVLEALNKKWNLVSIGHTALRAYVTAKRAERKVNELLTMMGLHERELPTDEESVQALYIQAQDDLKKTAFSAEEVLFWSRVFLKIGEEYFSLVETYTGSTEPWRYFLLLGQHLATQKGGVSPADIERQAAYRYLTYARQNMRSAAYFSIREKYGHRKAAQVIPDGSGTVDDLLLRLLDQP